MYRFWFIAKAFHDFEIKNFKKHVNVLFKFPYCCFFLSTCYLLSLNTGCMSNCWCKKAQLKILNNFGASFIVLTASIPVFRKRINYFQIFFFVCRSFWKSNKKHCTKAGISGLLRKYLFL